MWRKASHLSQDHPILMNYQLTASYGSDPLASARTAERSPAKINRTTQPTHRVLSENKYL